MGNSQSITPAAGSKAVAIKPVDRLKSMLNAPSVQEQFSNALGKRSQQFITSLIELYTGDKQLQTCAPALIVAEALRAATLDLPLNKALGFAYIVVYNNNTRNVDGTWTKTPTPTFIPGYKGYIQLAMRTGQYKYINADVVYEGEFSSSDKLTGEIWLDGNRASDKVVGYFCHFELLNGFRKTLYMSVEDMAKYAKRFSPSVRKQTTIEQLIALANNPIAGKGVGWEGDFTAMAIKTVTRRLLSKYGYLSVEMQTALAGDIAAEDSAAEAREGIVLEAEAAPIEVPVVDFVDTDTGEVAETPAPKADTPKAAPAPTSTAGAEEDELFPEY